jgi:hypothetical protein
MFKKIKNLLVVLCLTTALLFSTVSCTTTQSASEKKQDKVEQRVEASKKAIEKQINSIEDKGKAYIYGAHLSLDLTPREHPGVDIADSFIDLAGLTLGSPSLSDATKIQSIVDNLFAQVRVEEEKRKEAEAKIKVAELKAKEAELKAKAESLDSKTEKLDLLEQAKIAKEQAKNWQDQADAAHKEAEKAKKEVALGEKKLSEFSGRVITLENQLSYLNAQYEKDLGDAREIARKNAQKAGLYDAEHTFWKEINPFDDIWRGVKGLMGWVGVIFGGWLLLRVLGIFFPAVRVADWIVGAGAKVAFKAAPYATKYAGVVGHGVWKGFKNVVQAIEHTFQRIENSRLEEEVLKPFPDGTTFSKDQVRTLLQQHTNHVLEVLLAELDEHHTEDSRALVHRAKVDMGIKPISKTDEPL